MRFLVNKNASSICSVAAIYSGDGRGLPAKLPKILHVRLSGDRCDQSVYSDRRAAGNPAFYEPRRFGGVRRIFCWASVSASAEPAAGKSGQNLPSAPAPAA
jgi:hypothetical protein